MTPAEAIVKLESHGLCAGLEKDEWLDPGSMLMFIGSSRHALNPKRPDQTTYKDCIGIRQEIPTGPFIVMIPNESGNSVIGTDYPHDTLEAAVQWILDRKADSK